MPLVIGWQTGRKINDCNFTPKAISACQSDWDKKLYLFYQGDGPPYNIWCCASQDGVSWPGDHQISDFCTSEAVSACYYDVDYRIYLFWKANDNAVHYSSWDGKTWQPEQTINDSCTNKSPSACVFNRQLYVFWTDCDNNKICYSCSSGGIEWSSAQPINDYDWTLEAPSACAFKEKLYLFWKGADNDSIYYSGFDCKIRPDGSNSWPNGLTINDGDTTPKAVSSCAFEDYLVVFWKADDSDSIYYSASFNGERPWRDGLKILEESTPEPPCACGFQSALFAFWKADDNNAIWYSQGEQDTVTLQTVYSSQGNAVGEYWQTSVQTSGGTAPFNFAQSGTLPDGVVFDSGGNFATCLGTLTAAGTFSFTITVTDKYGATSGVTYNPTVKP